MSRVWGTHKDAGIEYGSLMLVVEAVTAASIAELGMHNALSADDLIDQLFVYSTMAEALKIAAISFTQDVRTLRSCAS